MNRWVKRRFYRPAFFWYTPDSVGETDQGYGYESQEEDDEDVYYYQEDNLELPGNTEEDAIMIDDWFIVAKDYKCTWHASI